jgi:hypothetical protein
VSKVSKVKDDIHIYIQNGLGTVFNPSKRLRKAISDDDHDGLGEMMFLEMKMATFHNLSSL